MKSAVKKNEYLGGGRKATYFFLIKKGISTEFNCCTFQFELEIQRTIQAVINYIYI